MKILKHPKIEKSIEFNKEENYYLCIENPRFYRETISDISKIESDESCFLLYEDSKSLNMKKEIYFIRDPMDLMMDEKKLNTIIQKELSASLDAQEKERYLLLLNEIGDFISSISYDYPLRLTYDSEMPLVSFLKSFSLGYESQKEEPLVDLLSGIRILSSIFNYHVFIIQNLMDYLTKEETNLFFSEIRRLEVDVSVFSSHLPIYDFDDESIIRIDDDLCEFHIEGNLQKS